MSAQQFKQFRKDLNLTQRQLAKELGLSEKNGDVYIRKVENGRCEPSGLLIRCFELFIERENKEEKFWKDAFKRLEEQYKARLTNPNNKESDEK